MRQSLEERLRLFRFLEVCKSSSIHFSLNAGEDGNVFNYSVLHFLFYARGITCCKMFHNNALWLPVPFSKGVCSVGGGRPGCGLSSRLCWLCLLRLALFPTSCRHTGQLHGLENKKRVSVRQVGHNHDTLRTCHSPSGPNSSNKFRRRYARNAEF